MAFEKDGFAVQARAHRPDRSRVGYRQILSITSLLQIFGSLAAFGAGIARPIYVIVLGRLVDLYNERDGATSLRESADRQALYLFFTFLGQWACVCVYAILFSIAAMRYTIRLRSRYIKAVVSQDLEQVSESGAATDLSINATIIEDALSEKLGTVLQAISTVVASLIIAFRHSWRLSLVLLSAVIFLIVKDMGLAAVDTRLEQKISNIDKKASSLAEESISGYRTVTSCCAAEKLGDRYSRILDQSKKKGIQKSPILAAHMGLSYFVVLGSYALSFWYGTRLLGRGQITSGGSILVVVFCINLLTNALRQLVPVYGVLVKAKVAHDSLNSVIDKDTRLDPYSQEGMQLDAIYSRIEFKNVCFSYPSRPSVRVLNNLNLTLGAGKVTAVVGPSGSGKSTIVELLERWYDITSGSIEINGVPIENYNLRALRSGIRVVQQDDILFNDTIYNNVTHGLIGSPFYDMSENDKRRLVIKVCNEVQAHDFIQQFPNGYDTVVGNRGDLLSGGQRQRIAIARAIISNPVILIFDEATSSLDAESERMVQIAVDRVSRGRTTLVIAHKLATVKRADRIVMLRNGEIYEEGSHKSLLRDSDTYTRLWMTQNMASEEGLTATATARAPTSHERDSSTTQSSCSFQTVEDIKISQNEDGHRSSVVDMTTENSVSFLETARTIVKSQKMFPCLVIISGIVCVATGAIYPGQAVILGYDVTAFQKSGTDLITTIDLWSLMLFILAFISLICFFSVGTLSSIGGTITARHYREKCFRAILEQPATFFEKSSQSPGALVACLSTYPSHLQGFMIVMTTFAVTVVNLTSVSVLGLVESWRFAIVALLGSFPIITFAGFLRVKSQLRKSKSLSEPLMDSAQYAAEAISNIRTISAFAMEEEVCLKMSQKMRESLGNFYKNMLITMPLFALSQSGNLLGVTISFLYSGRLLADHKIGALQLWIIFFGIVTGSEAAGEFFAGASSIVHARSACGKIMRLISSTTGSKPSTRTSSEKPLSSSITFDDVSFSYPKYPNQPVLQNLSVNVAPGQTVAIVGPSGSGKSTIISLLERFYDVTGGKIRVGGADLNSIDLDTYRSNVSLVSQETQLFEGTIRENIFLGVSKENQRDEILTKAAQDAHIHDFIMSLPEGYNTQCGKKGMAFSGGQRQRLAIARALVRNPSILLLDEATSALDSESEMEVKKALCNAAEGRTTVAVAHRLSTIQHVDRIFVLMKGSIVEEGTHAELTRLKGTYWRLCQLQNLD